MGSLAAPERPAVGLGQLGRAEEPHLPAGPGSLCKHREPSVVSGGRSCLKSPTVTVKRQMGSPVSLLFPACYGQMRILE